MPDLQTEADFRKNLNTTFRVQLDGAKPIDLTLVDVESRPIGPNEQAGMERFSALFSGPLEFFLPQKMYRVAHPEMGEFDVFLVAVGREADGFRYEAVYNYYRQD